jgi:CrcB protein
MAMTPLAWVAVAALGGAMAVARFLFDTSVATRLGAGRFGGGFPVGTLAVNLSGAVVLGVLAGAALSGSAYTIVAGGGVGTYTTFSTWMLESHRAGEGGEARVLWANIALSLVAGLAAVALGHWIGGLL